MQGPLHAVSEGRRRDERADGGVWRNGRSGRSGLEKEQKVKVGEDVPSDLFALAVDIGPHDGLGLGHGAGCSQKADDHGLRAGHGLQPPWTERVEVRADSGTRGGKARWMIR